MERAPGGAESQLVDTLHRVHHGWGRHDDSIFDAPGRLYFQTEDGMKRWLPWVIVAVFAAWVVGSLRVPPEKNWAYDQFGRLPVVANGRTQPFDSLARNTLLQLREKQTANLEPWKDWNEKPRIISATEWLLGVMIKPELADTWPVFRIDNPDLKGLLDLPADPDNAKRGPYDQALIKLWNNQTIYNRLKYTLGPAGSGDLDARMTAYLTKVEAGRNAFMARWEGKDFDSAALGWFSDQFETPLIVPVEKDAAHPQWARVAESVIPAANSGATPGFALQAYNRISKAFLNDNPAEFNAAVADYQNQLAGKFD